MDTHDINGIADNDNDNRSNTGELEQTRPVDGSTMQLKIDFPWEASESTC